MKLWQKLENLFAATAFAEEGEFETARQIAREEVPKKTTGRSGVTTGKIAHIPPDGTVTPSKA